MEGWKNKQQTKAQSAKTEQMDVSTLSVTKQQTDVSQLAMVKQENGEHALTRDGLEQLLKKYAIGKKPLSRLLGWGETTVLRYLAGEEPTKEYAQRLWLIDRHPELYLQLLEQGKERLTRVAYRKSRQAVENLLFGNRLNVVAYRVWKEMKQEHGMQALPYYCYYAQVLSMYLYGRELFSEDYQTQENLHPYPMLEQKQWGQLIFPDGGLPKQPETAEPSQKRQKEDAKEQMLIREVVFAFRWYGLETIRSMISHERNFLKITYNEQKQPIITKETLRQYFKKEFDALGIEEPKDFHRYVSGLAFQLIRR